MNFDVLIIGTGIAGLSCALKLAEKGLLVGLVSREKDPNISNTYYAQGGIIYPQREDKLLGSDILKAGSHTNNINAIEILKENGGKILNEVLLNKVEVDFSRKDTGELNLTREAAHSLPRILFKGDFTGREIQTSFLNYIKDIKRFPNIKLLQNHTAVDLLTPLHHGISINQRYEENKVVGAYLHNREDGEIVKALAKVTVLATGGIGSLYLHNSNSDGARGDGHAMANRAGALLTDMEFIQFHPTTFYNRNSHRRFLISEAVRGEGGRLVNCNGEEFMGKYHPDKELAPRDVVAKSIMEETLETMHDCVYLDISHKDPDWIRERFPTIYEHCEQNKIDITKEPIPVIPAAHYTCGGVKTDLKGKTSLKNLFAVGEVACTGLHGANRLASTSLLEGLTWGYLAAEEMAQDLNQIAIYPDDQIKDWEVSTGECDNALVNQDWLTLKQTMWNYVGLTRTKRRLKRAEALFREHYIELKKFYKHSNLTDNLIGLRNAAEVASLVVQASLINKKSIGCFQRKD
ncbi:MAG: L-aspartate oxidase [Epsilonproteobacteria bacterium]|nr:MAG: L-aspartate oxidase [Campylobacterota bacterium]RLA67029.1 MAG: L-aspartate oxidase [Campylobacterota bacterium]